jgi:flagellar biosynthesis/type III secretory pathway chaperone
MLQLDCKSLTQRVQSLAQQLEETDSRIGALETEAMSLNPLRYFVSQRKVDHLVGVKHALQEEWSNAMNELAICRSPQPAHSHFDMR